MRWSKASVFFGWRYKNKPLEDWLDSSHEGLKSKVKIESNQLAVEFAACERFGIDPIVQLARPRDERMAVAGYHVGRNMVDAMFAHDSKPKSKNKPGKKPRQ